MFFLSVSTEHETEVDGETQFSEEILAFTYGGLETVAYAGRQLLAELNADESGSAGREYALYMAEVVAAQAHAPTPENVKRDIVRFAGDVEVTTLLLRRKLAQLRKQLNPAPETPEGEAPKRRGRKPANPAAPANATE